jgi:hypothetical protein
MKKQILFILASTPLFLFAKPVKGDEIIIEENSNFSISNNTSHPRI